MMTMLETEKLYREMWQKEANLSLMYYVTAKYTGIPPMMCNGEWIIEINNVRLNIPAEIINKPFNTLGYYCKARKISAGKYVAEDCFQGKPWPEWCRDNFYWLSDSIRAVFPDLEDWEMEGLCKMVYRAVNNEDFIAE